jgi:peptide/nickel transport system substrate-binding protein
MRHCVAALALAAAACSPPSGAPRWRAAGHGTPRDGGTLRFAVKDQVVSLDPTRDYDEVSGYVVHAMRDTLVGYAPGSTRLEPRLAERWTVSPDARQYTFVLRERVAYSDGVAVRATDVRTALERARSTPNSPFAPFVANIAAIDVANDRQLAIALTRPDASFAFVLAMTFTSPQRADAPEIGCGPFALERHVVGERVVLRRNPHYWDAAHVHLDAIEMLENVPRDTQFLMFERGELDAAERLAAPDYLWITAQPAWQPFVHTRATMNAFGSRFNVRGKPFDDRRVRQALNYALDKEHSVKLLAGAAVAAHGILPPGVPGRDETLAPYPHDPARARALLAAAGYPAGFDIEYLIPVDEEPERLAGSLQHDLAEVGVRVRISEQAFASYAASIGSAKGPAFAKVGVLADYLDASSFLDANFHSRAIAEEGTSNYSFYANAELDALLDAAHAEVDPDQRAAMYRRAEHILYDDAPWLWDYHQLVTEVTQPYVQGYEPHPVWIRDYTQAWLDLDDDGERVAW